VWIAVPIQNIVQLDDVVLVKRSLSDRSAVTIYGIVDGLIARHEGAKLDSDVFFAEQGVSPLTPPSRLT